GRLLGGGLLGGGLLGGDLLGGDLLGGGLLGSRGLGRRADAVARRAGGGGGFARVVVVCCCARCGGGLCGLPGGHLVAPRQWSIGVTAQYQANAVGGAHGQPPVQHAPERIGSGSTLTTRDGACAGAPRNAARLEAGTRGMTSCVCRCGRETSPYRSSWWRRSRVQRALSRRFLSLASAGDVCLAKPNHAAVGCQQRRFAYVMQKEKTRAIRGAGFCSCERCARAAQVVDQPSSASIIAPYASASSKALSCSASSISRVNNQPLPKASSLTVSGVSASASFVATTVPATGAELPAAAV